MVNKHYACKGALDNSPVAVLIIQTNGKIDYLNQAALDLFGAGFARQMVGKSIQMFFDLDKDHLLSLFRNAESSTCQHKLSIKRCDGTLKPVFLKGYSDRTAAQEDDFLVCYLNDQPDTQQVLNSLQSRLMEAESANHAKTFFIANVSHGIRSHLNSILGLYQLLKDRSMQAAIPRSVEQFLDSIQFSIDQLQSLINSALDLNTVERGTLTSVCVSSFSIEQLMQSLLELYKEKAAGKSLWFTYEIDTGVPDYIEADRQILAQILSSLVDNALTFTEQGGAVMLHVTANQPHLEFTVKDEGSGMDAELIDRLSSPSELEEDGRFSPLSENGFGLTIVKRLTDLIKGRIIAQSCIGKGTSITVQIPLVESHKEIEWIDPGEERLNTFSQENAVLIVEDDAMNRDVYQAWFEAFPFSVFFAKSGDEALEWANTTKLDLIITDIMLPGINGIELISRLRESEWHRDTPIIVVTASVLDKTALDVIQRNTSSCLKKPLDFNLLLSLLGKYLSSESSEGKSEVTRQVLPMDLENRMRHSLKSIEKTPIFHLEKLIDEINQIKAVFLDQGLAIPDLLNQIESAAYGGDEKHIQTIIKQSFRAEQTSEVTAKRVQ